MVILHHGSADRALEEHFEDIVSIDGIEHVVMSDHLATGFGEAGWVSHRTCGDSLYSHVHILVDVCSCKDALSERK